MVNELIGHPERLNRDTLYELRRIVAQYPYYHAARLLLVENLFLLHEPDFKAELAVAASMVPDRRVLFQLFESINYELPAAETQNAPSTAQPHTTGNRTLDIIGNFLAEQPPTSSSPNLPGYTPSKLINPHDYMSVLEVMDDAIPSAEGSNHVEQLLERVAEEPHLQPLEESPAPSEPEATADTLSEEYYTETLAKVFIKQGNFERALDILQQIYLANPRKNAYFADQIRFLRKLVANQRHTK